MTTTTPPEVAAGATLPDELPSVAIVTLGCGRNEVDSDQLAGLFHREGLPVVDDPAAAQVVLVNTCTFIAPAKQESVDTVLEACALKDDGGARAVLVVGCMAQRYPHELAEAIPEADAIVGFDRYGHLPRLVQDILAGRAHDRVQVAPPDPGSRPARRTLPLMVASTQDDLDRIPASGPRFPVRRFGAADRPERPWAYLKIASGCDRACTFCAIPSFRGRFRSRPLDEILAEAAWLLDRGARELVLVSENTTSWGKDLPGGRDLQPSLLQELTQLDGLERVRLMYLQPAELQLPLLEEMAANPRVASYFDLSLQHVSGPVVTRMGRSGDAERFGQLVTRIRALDPQAVFRSNFILGFPGETEQDVAALERFLEEHLLDWVGLFPFSIEDGTPSAGYPDQVPPERAAERVARVSDLQERLADEASRRFIGRRLAVTVEEVDHDPAGVALLTAGRSYREAPDTDGEVQLVTADGHAADLPVGRTVDVSVVDSIGVDLVAVPEVAVAQGAARSAAVPEVAASDVAASDA